MGTGRHCGVRHAGDYLRCGIGGRRRTAADGSRCQTQPSLRCRHPAMNNERYPLIQDTEPALRRAGRVLVIDPASQVLLLEGFDPAEPDRRYWVTIGGGLEDGEEPAQAAVRELREETGIVATADELAGPVWQRSTEFSFDGTRYLLEEQYYLLRVGHLQVSLA